MLCYVWVFPGKGIVGGRVQSMSAFRIGKHRLSSEVCQQNIQMQLNVLFVDGPAWQSSHDFPKRLLSILRYERDEQKLQWERMKAACLVTSWKTGICPGNPKRSIVNHPSLCLLSVGVPEGSLIRMMFPSFWRAPEGSSLSLQSARARWNTACAWSGAEQEQSFLVWDESDNKSKNWL